jgi:hypothetical protein
MKIASREYDNKHYFSFIENSLYLIVQRPDGNDSIQKIKKKLKGQTQTIFDYITFYYCAIRIAKLQYDITRREQKDFNKIHELQGWKEECERLLDGYLGSIERPAFLEAISEIAYWIAKTEGAKQYEAHKNILLPWVQRHRYLNVKNKNKRKGEQMREKLKIILGDKINDFENIKKEHLKNVERFKDGKADIFINLDQELDVPKAEPNESFVFPSRWIGEKNNFRVIEEHTDCVLVGDKRYNLREYYEVIKGDINEEWIKSKDILKQVFTLYLIKRSQHGDDYAYTKLFDFYKDGANKISEKYAQSRKYRVDSEEVKGRALTILTALLKGDDPSHLFQTLAQGRSEKSGVDMLNKKVYLALNDSYETMFNIIYRQTIYLDHILNELEKKTKDYRNRSKKAKKVTTKKDYYNKVFTISQHTISKIHFTLTTFAMLNPLDFLTMSPYYNKYFFKSTPNANLTTWLFGKEDTEFKGMIWNSLCSIFDKRINKIDHESFSEDEYIETENPDVFKKIP